MSMTTQEYGQRLTNMAYHDLCEETETPQQIKQLLGLGMKFCIQRDTPRKEKFIHTIRRFEKDIRTKYFIKI